VGSRQIRPGSRGPNNVAQKATKEHSDEKDA
jgi:hypothetical protein